MTAAPDPLRNAATRHRIQKLLALRDKIRNYQRSYSIPVILGIVLGAYIFWPLATALISLAFFSVLAVAALSILPFVQFTLRGLFLTIVLPQLAFVLLNSRDGTLELLGCAVLTLWVTALVYFMGQINAAIERYEFERKMAPAADEKPTPVSQAPSENPKA